MFLFLFDFRQYNNQSTGEKHAKHSVSGGAYPCNLDGVGLVSRQRLEARRTPAKNQR